jgi:hypothetical protein
MRLKKFFGSIGLKRLCVLFCFITLSILHVDGDITLFALQDVLCVFNWACSLLCNANKRFFSISASEHVLPKQNLISSLRNIIQ